MSVNQNPISITTTDLPLSVFQVAKDYRRLQHVDSDGYINFPKFNGLSATTNQVSFFNTLAAAIALTPQQIYSTVLRLNQVPASFVFPSTLSQVRYLQRLFSISPTADEFVVEIVIENNTGSTITITRTDASTTFDSAATFNLLANSRYQLSVFATLSPVAISVRSTNTAAIAPVVAPPATAYGAWTGDFDGLDRIVAYDSASNVGLLATRTQFLSGATTGANNVLLTHQVNYSTNIGLSNVYVGANAGVNDIGGGESNVFVGTNAGLSSSGGAGNVFIGDFAGAGSTFGSNNVCIGASTASTAGNTLAGQNNVLIGRNIGTLGAGITGGNNNAIGQLALARGTSGSDNNCFGRTAAINLTTGSSNVCIGHNAGSAITTQSTITCLGNNAGTVSAAAGFVYLNPTLATSAAAVALHYDSVSGRVFPLASTRYNKTDIVDLNNVTDVSRLIESLRPVAYHWRDIEYDEKTKQIKTTNVHKKLSYGFIAEEVDESLAVVSEFSVSDKNGKPFKIHDKHSINVDDRAILAALVAVVQQQQKEIEQLKRLLSE